MNRCGGQITQIVFAFQLFLGALWISSTLGHAQSPGTVVENQGPDVEGQIANNRLFDQNFADFANLKSDTDLSETVQLFLAFVSALDIQVDSITGSLEDRMSIRNLRGRRNGKEFLSIGHLAIEWDISEITSGRLTVKRLLMDQVKVQAGWADSATDGLEFETGDEQENLPAFKIFGFTMPSLPLSLDVQDLLVRNLQLTKELIGQDIAVDLGGRLLIPSGQKPIDANLDIVRRDDVRGAARARLRWQPESGNLTMILGAEEGHNGLLQDVLNLDAKRSYQLLIEGQGPIRDWRSKMQFKLSGLTLVEGELGLKTSAKEQSARITGAATFLEDAKTRFPKLASEPVELDVQVGYRLNEQFRFDAINLSSRLLDLTGDGWINPLTADTDLNLTLKTKDESALEDVAPGLVLDRTSATVRLVRKGTEAGIRVDAEALRAGWANFETKNAQAQIEITDLFEEGGWTDAFVLEVEGKADNLININSDIFSLDEDIVFSALFDVDNSKDVLAVNSSNIELETRSTTVVAEVKGKLPTEKQRNTAGGWTNALRKSLQGKAAIEANSTFVKYPPFLKSGRLDALVTLKNGIVKSDLSLTGINWVNQQQPGSTGAWLKQIAGSKIEGLVAQSKVDAAYTFDLNVGSGKNPTSVNGAFKPQKSGMNVQARSRRFSLRNLNPVQQHLESGTADIRIDAKVRPKVSTVSFQAISTDLKPVSPRIANVIRFGAESKATGQLDAVKGKPVLLKNLVFTSGGLRIDAEASLPKSGNLQVQGTGRTTDINALLGTGSNLVTGSTSQQTQTTFIARGRGESWDIDLNAKLGPLANQNQLASQLLSSEDQVSARIEIRNGSARLAQLNLANSPLNSMLENLDLQQVGKNAFTGSARLKKLSGISQDLPPDLASQLGVLGGRVDFSIAAQKDENQQPLYTGAFATVLEAAANAPTGDQKPNLRIAELLEGTAIKSNFTWSNQNGFDLSGMQLQKNGSQATLDLNLAVGNKFESANIRIEKLDLAMLSPFVAQRTISGQISGPVRLSSVAPHQTLVIDYNLTVEEPIVSGALNETGNPFLSAQMLSVKGRVSGLASDLLPSANLISDIQAAGVKFGQQKFEQAQITLAGPLNRLGFNLYSRINADGVIGFLRVPTPNQKQKIDFSQFDIRINRLVTSLGKLGVKAHKPIFARVSKNKRFVTLENLRIGGVTFKGEIQTNDGNLNGEIEASSADLGWLTVFNGIGMARGSVTANLTLGGETNDPIGRGAFRISQAGFGRPRAVTSFIGDLPTINGRGALSIQGQALSVDGLFNGPRRMALDATLSLPINLDFEKSKFGLRRQEPIAGQFTGNMSAKEVSEFFALDKDDLTGRIELDARVGGTMEQPDITGAFNWLDARYENEASGLLLEELNIRGIAKGDRLVFKSEDGANLNIDGQISLKPKQKFPTHINIQSQRANLIARDDANLLVSSFLRLEGRLTEQLTLAGDVVINEAEVRMPNLRGGEIVKLEVIELNKPADLISEPLKTEVNQSIQTHIRIRSEDNLNFRGAGVSSKWGLNVNVRGPVAKPVLSGSLFSNSGGMTLLGKRFSLSRGEISYNQQTVEDPLLNILMERETESILVQLTVTGSLQSPVVNISSVPDLPTDQVISQLLFNDDPNQLNGVQAIELVTALTRLQNFGRSEDFVERLRLLTGLDSLTLAANSSDDTALRAGKNIGINTQVWVEQGLSTSSSRIGAEYRLLPNLRLETDYGIDQEGKVELDWTIDY